MPRYGRVILLLTFVAVLWSACSKIPDNARYIPQDAVGVVGVNLRSLSKKIAWNLITGSKLFKEIQKRMPAKNADDMVGGIEDAGLDVSNTFYVYTRNDNRFTDGKVIVGLIPLSDATKWEQYIKTAFPAVAVQQQNGRRQAALGRGMYAGWSAGLLILMNAPAVSLADEDADDTPDDSAVAAALVTAMDEAFKVPVANSIVSNKRFSAFQAHRYDLSVWLNYGSAFNSDGTPLSFNGISLSSAMWKDAIITAGFEFGKGNIGAEVNYFLPAHVEEATRDFGEVEADREMLDRLPKKNMDMLLSMHISPSGVRTLLEKVGLFGITNVGLATKGLDVDYLLEAFTGDMAILMSDFVLDAEMKSDMFMGQMVQHKEQKASMTMTYVIRINKKENFTRLLDMAKEGGMQPLKDGSGFVLPLTSSDSVFLMMNDRYAVITSKRNYATGFLSGAFKGQKMKDIFTDAAYGQPFALTLDINELFRNVDPAISNSRRDSAIISESKKLLSDITLKGGKYVDNAYKFSLDINFLNTDENSILELIDFGMRINDIGNKPSL